MRTTELSVNVNSTYLGQLKLEYPDEVVFVYNPLYVSLNISSDKCSSVKFSISTRKNREGNYKEIDAKLFNGATRIYISRIMELFFTDVRFERSKTLYANIIVNGKVVWSESFICIWGNLAVGDRFAHYGAFKLNENKPYFERKRIWFRNFPFTVSMFAHGWGSKDRGVSARYDGKPYDSTLKIHYPPIWGVINSLEDEIVNTFDDETTYDGDYLEGAVFDKQEQRFYGSTDDYCIYFDWTAGSLMPGPDEYNSNGKARTDKVWALQSGRLVRFDAQLGDLVEVPYGRSSEVGIYEICPEIAFPNAKRTATLKQKGQEVEVKTSTFDMTFDYTFWMSNEMSTITELIIDYSTAGHYLRWIDRFGMFQYFLFVKGKETLKNKLGANKVVEDYSVAGMYFSNHERVTNIEATKTVKCCALNLTQEIYDYVSSIVTSPLIDLYVGKTRDGVEMWVPVNIVASNIDYDPHQILHDIEISFTMPAVNAQIL